MEEKDTDTDTATAWALHLRWEGLPGPLAEPLVTALPEVSSILRMVAPSAAATVHLRRADTDSHLQAPTGQAHTVLALSHLLQVLPNPALAVSILAPPKMLSTLARIRTRVPQATATATHSLSSTPALVVSALGTKVVAAAPVPAGHRERALNISPSLRLGPCNPNPDSAQARLKTQLDRDR